MFSKNLAFTVQRFNRRSVGILRKGCSVGKAHVLAQQCQHAIPVATSSFSTASFSPPPKNEYNGTAVYDNIDISNTGEPTNSPSSIRKHDPNAVYVVTGASRGMGLQFVKTLLEPSRSHESSTIIACCRSPSSATLLSEYVDTLSPSQKKRVQIKQLDITKDDDIESLEKFMKETYNRVDVLFNIAGVLGDSKTTAGPERNITQLDRKWFQSQMDINAIGPMMVTKALLPFMKVTKKDEKSGSRVPSIVLNMSARVGSIADNKGGLGWHSHRMSKAALNMGTRVLSHEFKRSGVWTVAMYPGFTDTDFSVPFQSAGMKEKGMVFPVDFTVGRMLDVMEGMGESNSGGLYDWSGVAMPF